MFISDFLNKYIGVYTPVTYKSTTLVPLGDGTFEIITDNVIAQGVAGVDWPYILSFILFIFVGWLAVLFCSAFYKTLVTNFKSILQR